jgi:broad specificity phosphatase PhoE
MSFEPRDRIEVSVVRHGPAADNLSTLIERGEKPPYLDFKAYLEGTIEPSIEVEKTRRLIRDRIEKGELTPGAYNVLVPSVQVRARETATLLKQELKVQGDIQPLSLLSEVKIPMISERAYNAAQNIDEVRELYFDDFLNKSPSRGYETPRDVFRRAQKVLHHIDELRTQTPAEPIFVTHWIFMKFLQLSIIHSNESLTDEQVDEKIRVGFRNTKRFGVVQGFSITSTKNPSTFSS